MLQTFSSLEVTFAQKYTTTMKRTVIKIDEEICNGCGLCVDGCHEGALQLIDGKARMISDLYCDGLGACIGECPLGAIELEEREAEPYNEYAVMERIAPKGEKTIRAHLLHLKQHNETAFLNQGIDYLKEHKIEINMEELTEQPNQQQGSACGCQGSRERVLNRTENTEQACQNHQPIATQLRHWPVQLRLLNPEASFLKDADLVLAADCTAYAYGDFHNRFMKNRVLSIACPKLDTTIDHYIEKLTVMIDKAQINTLTVIVMEVPCCSGLLQIVRKAAANAARKIPIKKIIIGIEGDVLSEEWI